MTSSAALARIHAIVASATVADGAAPLDEATLMLLDQHPEQVVVRSSEDGFSLLHHGEIDLVVEPSARRAGLGGALLKATLEHAGQGPLRAWSHGNHPGAAALASTYGFERVRDLWVMRRPTSVALPELPVRPGISIRGYRDTDADALLRINAAAFAAHPEQGTMDAENLAARMAEPWFDPAGLLIAERDDRPVGFHWTKQHSPDLGEVYVVGVDPAAQGGGLGRLLTLAGLHHLHRSGVSEVLLYVESDNHPAVAVYSALGFGHDEVDTHVQYLRPALGGGDPQGAV